MHLLAIHDALQGFTLENTVDSSFSNIYKVAFTACPCFLEYDLFKNNKEHLLLLARSIPSICLLASAQGNEMELYAFRQEVSRAYTFQWVLWARTWAEAAVAGAAGADLAAAAAAAASRPCCAGGPLTPPACTCVGRPPVGPKISALQSELSTNITELQPAIAANLHEPGPSSTRTQMKMLCGVQNKRLHLKSTQRML
jgi:hypothetical protein